jgi:hypothetical protein
MNAVEIEQAITDLAEQPYDPAAFPYAFLEAFGNKETTLTRASLPRQHACRPARRPRAQRRSAGAHLHWSALQERHRAAGEAV